MSASVEALPAQEDNYDEDDFVDDFESDDASSTEGTPQRSTHAAPPQMNAEELSPSSSHRSSSSTTTQSSATASSSSQSLPSKAVAAVEQHAEEAEPHSASAPSYTSSSSSPSTSSSTSSSASRKSSFSKGSESHVSSHGAPAADAGDQYAQLEESTAADATAAELEEEEGSAAAIHADEVHSGVVSQADGSPSEPRSRGGQIDAVAAAGGRKRGAKRAAHGRRSGNRGNRGNSSRQRSLSNSATPGWRHVQRPVVPQNAEELEAMQAENARLRDQLFEMSREHYHTALALSTKAGYGMSTSAGGGTVSLMMTNNSGAAGASAAHRDVTARLVQESLMAHRTLQMLRLDQRDLMQRRSELKKLVSQYKKASKFRELVEGVKQEIADLQEEHRDVQLEVRCNEKLLLLAEHMAESGMGDRRVQEEIRAQSALTQRRRECTLRDADAAQRKRDGAAQRVEELRIELEKRLKETGGGRSSWSSNLLAENRAKKERIRELRAQLQDLERSGQGSAGSNQPRYQTQQSVRDDAERVYLRTRIAKMQLELNAAVNNSDSNSTPLADAAATQRPTVAATLTAGNISPTRPSSSPELNEPRSPPKDEVKPTAPCAPLNTEEIDVASWLSDHPVAAAVDPSETLRGASVPLQEADSDHHQHSSSNIEENAYPTDDSAGQNVDVPPAPQPPYAQEPVPESAPAPVAPPLLAEEPAWLGGALEEEAAPADSEAAPPLEQSSPYPTEDQNDDEHFEEEVVDDEEELEESEDLEELDEPAPVQPAVVTAASPETPKEDDGPDWLNF
ncbi:hypothetical protein ABL78_3513 [Leptomonas seymouri]|uniref:Uncharacterized protein n=1 Tax=Leptomonas seymouri TaxID=5684 RepID=A0A0N0P6B4_LEPSE|nr:hypothetical protein ABL78_3513 [Leptomonas seymouri]|eukprot:KPI87429.1 hypothetical protein ABL78_3513 [Leptomonas seymouri]